MGGAEREREGEREKESQAGSALSLWSPVSAEPDVGLELTNHEIMTWAETKSQMLNGRSHPGAPRQRDF